MNPIELFAVGAGGLALAVAIHIALSYRAQTTKVAIGRLTAVSGETDHKNTSAAVAVIENLPFLESLVISSQREIMAKKLWRLGYFSPLRVRALGLVKLALGVFLGLLGTALGSSQPAAALLLGVAFFALGIYLPDIVIDRRLQATEESISRSLPSTIDLINICIRSGMNLERALARVAEEATGPIEIDLNTIAERASLGDSVEDAVKTLSANQEISVATSTFLSTIARATRLGVPLGQVIEQTADDMRKRQIDIIKTSAAKLPVKILMPLMLLLLPAVLLVVLGPAVLSLVEGLSSL